MKNLVGKFVDIIDEDSDYYGMWGKIIAQDEDGLYHIAICCGTNSIPVFERNQFRVKVIEVIP